MVNDTTKPPKCHFCGRPWDVDHGWMMFLHPPYPRDHPKHDPDEGDLVCDLCAATKPWEKNCEAMI